MKTKIIAYALGSIILVVGLSITFFAPKSVTEYVAQEVIVEVDALEQALKSAQDAKKSEIEAVAEKARVEARTQEMKKVELEVISEFSKKLDVRKVELQKETKVY